MDTAILLLGTEILATEPTDIFNLILSPNPSAGDVTLRYHLKQRTDIQLTILDATGRTISTINWPNQSVGDHQQPLPARLLPTAPGIYLLQFDADGQTISQKILRF